VAELEPVHGSCHDNVTVPALQSIALRLTDVGAGGDGVVSVMLKLIPPPTNGGASLNTPFSVSSIILSEIALITIETGPETPTGNVILKCPFDIFVVLAGMGVGPKKLILKSKPSSATPEK